MADCSYTRCIQERRIIKKHLQKWTKSCIYTLGFERVAEEFMGRRQWRLYQERVLKSWCPSIEQDLAIKDWDPSDDKCTFCDLDPAERDSDDVGDEGDDEEAGSPLRPGSSDTSASTIKNYNNNIIHNNNNDSSNSNKNNIDLLGSDSSESSVDDDRPLPGRRGGMNAMDSSIASMAAIAALAGPCHGVPYYAAAFPTAQRPQWLQRPLLDALAAAGGAAKAEAPMVMSVPATTPQTGAEMPLDLSAKSSKSPPASAPEPLPGESIRVPGTAADPKQLFGADWPSCRSRPRMSPMSGRRTYTEDELQAALRDIQSGKLGTRRAAVIYGIPRSTLRNKVYKLALERERDAHVLLGAALPRASPPDAASTCDPSATGAGMLPTVPQSSSSAAEKEDSSAEDESSCKDQHPGLSMDDLLRLSAVDRGPPPNSVLASYLAQLLKLKENVSPGDEETSLMKRIMAEEQKNGSSAVEEDQSNVILRIPSFKPNAAESSSSASERVPTTNGDASVPAGDHQPTHDVLRDAIAKSISQKFQSGSGSGETTAAAIAAAAGYPHHLHHQPPQQHPHHQHQQRQNPTKGTRPKRGKYRNYDRDSLVEAVRAVQRGEMSVHRAGSYYGVPHSTLEYKVKERHLMRPRKREPKTDIDKSKSSAPTTTNTEKTPSIASKQPQQPIIAPKPKPPYAPPPPNGLKFPPNIFDGGVSPLTPYGPAPFPFWPPNPYGLPPIPDQLFATPGGIPPNTRRIAESLYDGSGHNGSFLDGIIRSSLDLGVKKDANSAALMEQLCRNARGGPPPFDLSRSSDEESDEQRRRDESMGDEDIDEDIDNISNHASDEDEMETRVNDS